MLNINYGKNKALMRACAPLNEYAWLVNAIRKHRKELKNLEVAIDAAIDEMPDEFIIKKFLLLNKAEVKGMFLTEYNQEKVLEQVANDERRQTAMDMLRDGEPLEKIARYSRLADEAIRKLADSLGVAVV